MGGAVVGLGVFLTPYAFPTPPPIVRGFQTTSIFSPNGDGARDVARVSFRMNEPGEAEVLVTPHGAQDPVRTLHKGDTPAGIVRLEWDGRDDAGRPVPDGQYVISLRARSGQKVFNVSRRTTVSRVAPRLGTLTVRSAVLDGPGDGECRVAATALDRGAMTLTALPATEGEPVATITRPAVTDGQSVVWDWDGTGDGGAPVTPGVYLIRAALTDRARNTSTRTATCWVGHAIGTAIPAAPRMGTRPRIRLTTIAGKALAPSTRVTLHIARRTADPGGTGTGIVGATVGGSAKGPLATTRITLPRQIPPSRLWIVATTDTARAIIPLRP